MNSPSASLRPALAAGFLRLTTAITGLSLLVTGCVSLRSVPLPVSGQPAASVAVKVGDHVQVQTRSGETYQFEVTAVESDALIGKSRRVRYEDMAGLQVKHLDQLRTGVAVVGTTLGVLAVVALIALASGGFVVMPPGP